MTRPSWDAYFLSLARTVSTRATCPRRQVGCVLVRDRVILSTGYNGAIRGEDHCPEYDDAMHLWPCAAWSNHCQRSIHAETNAVLSAARNGVALEGCTAYVTLRPCLSCYRNLVNAGVAYVVYAEAYGEPYETSVLMQMSMHVGGE